MGWTFFLLTYLLGGITFLPLIVVAILVHAHLTFPTIQDAEPRQISADDDLVQPGDELDALKAAQKDDARPRTSHHDSDVAAGYFAVCREYTPMGINAKPIERSTPVGSATVAAPSPSVYQTMYRSIFDRKTGPGPLDNKNGAHQRPKKAGNVFYVVLRHGYLMLFDDDEQLEVRHVVSLAHHDISIYSGEETTPEGELFIKRNAICLSRKTDGFEVGPDNRQSKPFFLFSENCSAKEDFYFALLRNQEQSFAPGSKAPSPIHFDVKNIISLVQRLHSSEEHMQTRWLNAIIGRIFLAIHKTKDIENAIREKLTKKISRVKRPSFLSNIAIKAIHTGESAPYITNPRLRDLTIEGECVIEADMRYTGNFRLEVAATARIDLGSRFKAREVNLVLAVVIRKIEGHVLVKVKPPPSNRIWFSFQQMPKIEMTIEPIVSSRQITYTVILRQIESRIKEVIAETVVLPFWDDTPFFRTEHKKWRGGIFGDDRVEKSIDLEALAAQEGDLDEVDRLEENQVIQETELPPVEKSHSMPVLNKKPSTGLFGRKSTAKNKSDSTLSPSASSTSIETRSDTKSDTKSETATPRTVRSASFVQPSPPTVETDATNADIFKPSSSPPDESPAATAMASLSAKSQPSSPAPSTTNLAPFKPYITSKSSNHSSSSSREATDTEKDKEAELTPQPRRNTASSTGSHDDQAPKSPSLIGKGSIKSQAGSITRGFFSRRDTPPINPVPGSPNNTDAQNKRTALAAVTNAAASAKRWGLGALQRHTNENGSAKTDSPGGQEPPLDLNKPMGRGRPLPPPGVPLPMPERKTPTAAIPVPKRKLVPPPVVGEHGEVEERHQHERRPLAPPPPSTTGHHGEAEDHHTHERRPLPPPTPPIRVHHSENGEHHKHERRPVPPPPLPSRRRARSGMQQQEKGDGEDMLVVAAPPADSEPTTPLSASAENGPSYVQPWVEDIDNDEQVVIDRHDTPAAAPVEEAAVHEAAAPTEEQGKHEGKAASVEQVDDDDDDDYSAWMDNTGLEDPVVTSSTV
ncbi:hypothetical protein B0T19DRAFT_57858 [Cercophora scortea]|uniref:SMP-LTD domain-containing protein n=1 Tax=Cercophora scortea TaxID=314031 RepID=A0AAE0J502_9PEZI|nr:hypothetical protein B0T19DRAFT_57858 [Cercophora scortea]